MINRNLITSFFLIGAMTVSVYGQGNTKTLKQAYAKKYLMGTASDLNNLSEADRQMLKHNMTLLLRKTA